MKNNIDLGSQRLSSESGRLHPLDSSHSRRHRRSFAAAALPPPLDATRGPRLAPPQPPGAQGQPGGLCPVPKRRRSLTLTFSGESLKTRRAQEAASGPCEVLREGSLVSGICWAPK